METEKKLATMEEELKLMKGEVKQSLASVRDYLLNMELPSSEFATVLAALGSEGEQKITMKGSFTNDQPREAEKPSRNEAEEEVNPTTEQIHDDEGESATDELPAPEADEEEEFINPDDDYVEEASTSPSDYLEEYPKDQETDQEDYAEPEDEPFTDEDLGQKKSSFSPDAELPAVEDLLPRIAGATETGSSIPKVNLLANLMQWVTTAKKDIGIEQLPLFLEVYGISGHLSPDLKELILHMADIASDSPDAENTAATWSRTMLSLHGILTGGDAPLNPVKSFWHEDESETPPEEETTAEPEPGEETPFKLKLVLPTGNGQSQEFCLDLKPEMTGNGSKEVPENRQPIKEGGDMPWQNQRKKR